MRPLTYTSAKQLVPVANKPVLFYGIEALAAAGIRDIGIVVGDTQAEIRAAVGDGAAWNVDITYIEQDAPLGLAHAVLISQSFIGDDPFIVYLGDNLLAKGIVPFVERFVDAQPAAQILLARVSDPKRFGVAELAEDGRVKKLVEKPAKPKSDLALVGVYMFQPEVFQAVRSISPSPRNELEITDAIQQLIDNGLTVTPHIVDGWWKDTGKLEDILEANRLILETMERRVDGEFDTDSQIDGNVVVEPGASIKQSKVRGPVIIGADARITSAYIGPFTSIMNNVRVHDSAIEHSIVLEGSDLSGLQSRMTDSLIGKNVKILRDPETPSTYRFMLGDNSEVGIP